MNSFPFIFDKWMRYLNLIKIFSFPLSIEDERRIIFLLEPRKLALEVVVAEAIAIAVRIGPVSITLIASARMITTEATIASRITATTALKKSERKIDSCRFRTFNKNGYDWGWPIVHDHD